jgi:hypothetical protein
MVICDYLFIKYVYIGGYIDFFSFLYLLYCVLRDFIRFLWVYYEYGIGIVLLLDCYICGYIGYRMSRFLDLYFFITLHSLYSV